MIDPTEPFHCFNEVFHPKENNMIATDILKSEHRVIEQTLTCLERIAQESRNQGRLEAEAAHEAIEFFRIFADRCHHGKEESHLFPAMEAKGFPRDGGPTGVMLAEHEDGRAHVRAMAAAVDEAAAGQPKAIEAFSTHAQAYINLLREHIEKEDHCLFSMANQAFSSEDQAALLAEFDRVESEEIGAGTHEKFLAIAERLADRYSVPKENRQTACGGCCGHH